MRVLKREDLLALLAYLILAVVMTWPLIARLGTHVPLGNADVWLNYWNLWWWKTALLQGRSPYYSEMIFFPTGVPLGLHTHSPANMLWTLPINVVFGMAPALNLSIFAGFVLAGVGGFLLAREYTQKALPAFLGGIALAYFPQHVDQATEHLNLASYWAMPLFLWALVRCIRHGGKRWAVITGLFFALNALLAWHNALLSIPLGIGVALFETWRGERPVFRVALDLTGAAALSSLVVASFFWPVVRDSLAGAAAVQKPFFDRPLEAVSLLLPHPGHPIWGFLLTDTHLELRSYSSVGSIGYLGVVTLALSICAVLVRSPARTESARHGNASPQGATLFWWLALLFFLTLTLGEDASLRLPYSWLKNLPLFGLVRIPNRFLVPAMLALSVLAAMGANRLGERVAPGHLRILIGVLGLAMLVDYAWIPFPMRELPQAEWPLQLQGVPPEVAILDIPMSHDPPGAFQNYLQTEHERPIVGGYIAAGFRPARQQLKHRPALWAIRTPFRSVKADEFQGGLTETIRDMGVGLVVVHLQHTKEQFRAATQGVSRDDPNTFHRVRLYDPKAGLPQDALAQIRYELTSEFGDPIHRTPEVEIYRVSSSTELP